MHSLNIKTRLTSCCSIRLQPKCFYKYLEGALWLTRSVAALEWILKVTNSSLSSSGIFLFSAVLPHFVKVETFKLKQNQFNLNVSFGCRERCRNTALPLSSAWYSNPPSSTALDLQGQQFLCLLQPLFPKLYIVLHPPTYKPIGVSIPWVYRYLSLAFRKRLSYDPPASRSSSRGARR